MSIINERSWGIIAEQAKRMPSPTAKQRFLEGAEAVRKICIEHGLEQVAGVGISERMAQVDNALRESNRHLKQLGLAIQDEDVLDARGRAAVVLAGKMFDVFMPEEGFPILGGRQGFTSDIHKEAIRATSYIVWAYLGQSGKPESGQEDQP